MGKLAANSRSRSKTNNTHVQMKTAKGMMSPSTTSLCSSGKKTPCISAIRQYSENVAMSIVEQRGANRTEQRSVIREAENENSSMCMHTKSDGQTNADALMGSHLIKDLELYP